MIGIRKKMYRPGRICSTLIVFQLTLLIVFNIGGVGGTCPKGCKCIPEGAGDKPIHRADCSTDNVTILIDELPTCLKEFSFTTYELQDSSSMFTRFPNLTELRIRNVYLTNPSHNFSNYEMFNGLGKLERLIINFPTKDLHSQLFLPLKKLRLLDLSNTGFLTTDTVAAVLEGSKFRDKPIKKLLLRQFTGVGKDCKYHLDLKVLLPSLDAINITTLDASDNDAVYLYPGFVSHAPHLEELHANNIDLRYDQQKIKEVVCTIFDLFFHKSIRYINLSKLRPIRNLLMGDAETRAQKMITFSKDSNSTIYSICQYFQQQCGEFFSIGSEDDICSNIEFDDSCFPPIRLPLPQNLETLIVSDVQFARHKRSQGRVYKAVCFADNKLKTLNLDRMSFPSEDSGFQVLRGFESLKNFSAVDSSWGQMLANPRFFHTITSLETLDFSGTSIGVYMSNDSSSLIFEKLLHLRNLTLRNADISYIHSKAFQNLKYLSRLDLSSNKLDKITFDIGNLLTLQFLNLSENAFKFLTENVTILLDLMGRNMDVDLLSNRLICDCDSFAFLEWFQKSIDTFSNKSEYYCTSQYSEGKRIEHVSLFKLRTHCYRDYIVALGSAGFVLLISLCVLTIYKNRHKIKYSLIWIKYRKQIGIDDAMAKDAFIIYADEDRFWVHGILLPKLEKEMGQKTVVHHRDFLPGHDIQDQIVRNIGICRKTIAILSPDFVKSGWCEFELNVARCRLQNEGRDVVIPVILRELARKDISPGLKQILSEKVWIKWEGEGNDKEKYFWMRLNLSLGRRIKIKKKSSDQPQEPAKDELLGLQTLKQITCDDSDIMDDHNRNVKFENAERQSLIQERKEKTYLTIT